MKHYICTGECGGVSEELGVCSDEKCTMYNEPLKECKCPSKENHINSEEKNS